MSYYRQPPRGRSERDDEHQSYKVDQDEAGKAKRLSDRYRAEGNLKACLHQLLKAKHHTDREIQSRETWVTRYPNNGHKGVMEQIEAKKTFAANLSTLIENCKNDLGHGPTGNVEVWAPKLPYLPRGTQDLDTAAFQKTSLDANERLGQYAAGNTTDEESSENGSHHGSGQEYDYDNDNVSLRSFASRDSHHSYMSEHSDFYGQESSLDARGSAYDAYVEAQGYGDYQGGTAQVQEARSNVLLDSELEELRRRYVR